MGKSAVMAPKRNTLVSGERTGNRGGASVSRKNIPGMTLNGIRANKEGIVMPELKFLWGLGAVVFLMTILIPSESLYAQKDSEPQYEVLSPWAEADPMPLRGLSAPRLNSLAGKKIGLFVNYKRAARPIAESVERRLNAMYPDARISYFVSPEWNVSVVETPNKDKFEAWAKGVDAVILSIGD
jgi:hypothetical protein